MFANGYETDSLELNFDSIDYAMYEFAAAHDSIPDSVICNSIHRRFARRILKAYSQQYEYYINSSNNPELDKILIIVSDDVYDNIPFYIIRYAHDIHNAYGCETLIYSVNDGGTYTDIKSLITSNSTNLNGCVFIGDIVDAQYHLDTVTIFGKGYSAATWPCDLYYMDLNGVWTDSDHDGIFDGHTGLIMPEIFVGRISTYNYKADELDKLKDFFDKDHRYWLGQKKLNKKYALSFTEKDWYGWDDWTTSVKNIYGNQYYDTIGNYGFTLTNYKSALSNPKYEFIHMSCHSSSTIHRFIRDIGVRIDTVDYKISYFDTIAKKTVGYNLFCCSACNWTNTTLTKQCLGEMYIYDNSEAICVLGTTKTGGMRFNDKFYKPLGNGKCIGQAHLDWWINHCNVLHNKVRKHRYYGLCVLGDPLVSFQYESQCEDEIILNNITETQNASYYAKNLIKVKDYSIPNGKNVIIGAPRIEMTGPFTCGAGASLTATAEGCICYNSSPRNSIGRHTTCLDEESETKENIEAYFTIYPNPVRTNIIVECSEKITYICICTLSGQPVLQTAETNIDVSSLPAGMYIVCVITADGEQLQGKFIKQ